ncbi:Iap family predicted aminopeptidase [Kitasatospora sp. GAS1066B]
MGAMAHRQHWLIRFTDELMTLTDDLTQEQAADFVRRVYVAGHEAGVAEAAEENRRERE